MKSSYKNLLPTTKDQDENRIFCHCGGTYLDDNPTLLRRHILSKRHTECLETGITKTKATEDIKAYLKEYYKNHKEVWYNTPSSVAKRQQYEAKKQQALIY